MIDNINIAFKIILDSLMSSHSKEIITVQELHQKLKYILTEKIGTISLIGEISSLITSNMGHVYFTLKDNASQIKCVMFKNRAQLQDITLKEGIQVVISADISIYQARGDLQLIVHTTQHYGEGLLKKQFEQLKNKLAEAGLFDQKNKKPIPKNIKTVGIITSQNTAALQDVLSVLQRRNPSIHVIIYPCIVQGNEAVMSICNMIEIANQENQVDCLLLTRGGGALEDLFCFNHENVAYCIAQSQLPIISAIGHETDFTIADFVADIRAPTPSVGAELISADLKKQYQTLLEQYQRIIYLCQQLIEKKTQQLKYNKTRIHYFHPKNKIEQLTLKQDELYTKIQQLIHQIIIKKQNQLINHHHKLLRFNPKNKIDYYQQKIIHLQQHIHQIIEQIIYQKQTMLNHKHILLYNLNPENTLLRGYSITSSKNNTTITSINQVKQGDTIYVKMIDGKLTCQVMQKQ